MRCGVGSGVRARIPSWPNDEAIDVSWHEALWDPAECQLVSGCGVGSVCQRQLNNIASCSGSVERDEVGSDGLGTELSLWQTRCCIMETTARAALLITAAQPLRATKGEVASCTKRPL